MIELEIAPIESEQLDYTAKKMGGGTKKKDVFVQNQKCTVSYNYLKITLILSVNLNGNPDEKVSFNQEY